MANGENTNSAHEKCHGWQRKNIIRDIPSGSSSVNHSIFRVHCQGISYQKCQCCLYQSHCSAVSSSHSNVRLECSWIGPESQAGSMSISIMYFLSKRLMNIVSDYSMLSWRKSFISKLGTSTVMKKKEQNKICQRRHFIPSWMLSLSFYRVKQTLMSPFFFFVEAA